MNQVWEGAVTSRRALLGLGLTGLVGWSVTGCDDASNSDRPPTRSRATFDPDHAVASHAAGAIVVLQSYVRQVLDVHPELSRGSLAGFALLHHQQLRRIKEEPDFRGPPLPGGWRRNPTLASDAVRKHESSAADTLSAEALEAESGALAGLIAQLAAGIDMHLSATAAAPLSLAVEPEIANASPTIQIEAMQKTLADEHAALYLYGVLGAHTSASGAPALYAAVDAAYAAHRARRDRLTALLEDAGEDPVASEPGYVIPAPLRTDVQVAAEALSLERAAAARYLWLVENAVDDVRALGVAALRNTAVRELSFRGSPEIFPGAI